MEDQGKRLLLALAASFVVIFVAQYFMTSRPAPPPPALAADAGPTLSPSGAGPASQPASQPVLAPAIAVERESCDPAVVDREPLRLQAAGFEATFSRCGAVASSWVVRSNQYREKDGRPLDLVRSDHRPLGVDLVTPKTSDPTSERIPVIPVGATWEGTQTSPEQVDFVWRSSNLVFEVRKTFRVVGSHAVELNLIVKNTSPRPNDRRVLDAAISVVGYQDPQAKTSGTFTYAEPHWATICYVDGKAKSDGISGLAQPKVHSGHVGWAGLSHKYFLFVIAPKTKDPVQCTGRRVDGQPLGTMEERISFTPSFTLDPGQGIDRQVVVYAGPKALEELEAVQGEGWNPRLGDAVDLGWVAILARPMLWALKVFHGWVGNWGIAIILLTITIKLLTLYWTHKSMISMKEMAKLGPKMKEIQERWKDDKQRLNEEVMRLYKSHNVNPLSGCLPMLLQMPIWIALWSSLNAAAELYRAPLVGWIKDLTVPDPYFSIPILTTAAMFLQSKLSPQAADSSQQKMMMYGMPILFGGMSLFFPAGLSLYILTNTILGMVHQVYVNRVTQA